MKLVRLKTTLMAIFGMVLCFGMSTIQARDTDSLMAMLDSVRMDSSQAAWRLELAEAIRNPDISGALEYARQALHIAEQTGNEILIAKSKLAIGRYYDYLGVREEALIHLTEALDIFQALDMAAEEAQCILLIGNSYWYMDQFNSALKYYMLAAQYGKDLNDTTLLISVMNATGAVYGNTGMLDSAMILFRQANEMARMIGNRDQEILTLYNMGDVNLYSGRLDDALGIFYDLENNYELEKYSSKHLGNLYNSMTHAFIEIGDLKWARRYSEKTSDVLRIYTRLTESRDYYMNCYRIDTLEGNTEAALSHYQQYTALNDSLNDTRFHERLASLEIYFDLQAKDLEIERLTLDNQYKDLQIRQRRIINRGAIGGLLLFLTIILLSVRSGIRTRKQNVKLAEQKKALELANNKISAQSSDLLDKNQKLETVIEELKATQQHLVQSEKMASLGTLTAGIAHEINNPLNFISGGLGILDNADKAHADLDEKELKKRRTKAMKMAFDGLERASGIVKALMTFSHKGNSRKVKSDLEEIIENTLLFLKSKISADITVVKDYQLKKKVSVYPEKMHQVVMNIIDNAIHAVNKGREKDKEIQIHTRQVEDRVVLRFINNGPPVEEEALQKLFDPFFTTKDPGEGTGLGLSICYNLIGDHRGSIRAENQEDGVAFIIELPL